MHACFFLFASLRKSGRYIVVRIKSSNCSFVRVARCFDFTNVSAEDKHSQQYVTLNTEMSRTLVFWVLVSYFLEPVARTQLHSDIV